MLSGLKIAWVKRIHDPHNKGKWKCFFDHYLDAFGGNIIWQCNVDTGDVNMKRKRKKEKKKKKGEKKKSKIVLSRMFFTPGALSLFQKTSNYVNYKSS